jgi:hypothetical protein
MLRAALLSLALLSLAGGGAFAQGSILDQGKDLLRRQTAPDQSGASRGAGLTSQQAEGGLREALRTATQRTVARVGKTDGYLKDPAIRIPLPGFLASAKSTLGKAGAAGPLDDLELRMNRAAEAAAPKAVDIFGNAIASMSVSDAKAIVSGANDAATQYFKRTTTGPLTAAFRPIVERSLADAGATRAYESAMQRVSSASPLGSLGGSLGGSPAAGSFNLTDYAVEKSLDGLFHYVAQEEAAIRTNPAARTTDVLKQVFGR